MSSPVECIDVSFLRTDEVSLLNRVIAKDQVVKSIRRAGLNNSRKHLEKARTKQKRRGDSRMKCSLCDCVHNCFTKCQACPVCNFIICERCVVYVKLSASTTMCRVCYEAGLFYGQYLSLQEDTKYGSHLLHKSLKVKDKSEEILVPNEHLDVDELSSHHSSSHSLMTNEVDNGYFRVFANVHPGAVDVQHKIGGSLYIELMYKRDEEIVGSGNGDLYISVKRAHFIDDVNRDTFVTCHLLSDGSSHNLKTEVLSHQVNPVWNDMQVLTSLNTVNKNEFIEFCIWDCSNPSNYLFMGGVILGSTSYPFNRNCCIEREIFHWQAILKYHNNWIGAWHTLRSVTGDYEDTIGKTIIPSISEIIEELEDLCKSVSDYQDVEISNIPSIQFTVSSESQLSNSSLDAQYAFAIISEVLLAIEFMDNLLLIHVNKVTGLHPLKTDVLLDPYVKTYLLPEKSKKWKRKTSVKHNTLNPEYYETLKYVLPPSTSFSDYTIWLTVWNYEKWKKNSLLAEAHIPLHDLNLDQDTYKQWSPVVIPVVMTMVPAIVMIFGGTQQIIPIMKMTPLYVPSSQCIICNYSPVPCPRAK